MGDAVITLSDAEEIEAFYLETTGMKPGFLQLSAGQAGMHMRVVDLDGISLVWARVEGRTKWQDQFVGDGLHLGFALDSAGPVFVRGRELRGDEAQVWMPGQDMEYTMQGPVTSFEIGVSRSLMDELGWVVCGDPLRRVSRERMQRLVRLCGVASEAPLGSGIEWRDQVLNELEPLLRPWTNGVEPGRSFFKGTAHYQLLKATERYFESLGEDERLCVERMAEEIGAPRRTIFHAYRKLLGIGPRRYLELIRLQQLRQRLVSADPEQTTVTREALRSGFSHPGRLPQIYRQQYGENPVTTLNRI